VDAVPSAPSAEPHPTMPKSLPWPID